MKEDDCFTDEREIFFESPLKSSRSTETTCLISHSKFSIKGKIWPQHLAAILASLSSMATGTVSGWSSPAIPHLQGNMGNVSISLHPITDYEASWVGSIATLGCLFGAIPAGNLSHIIGRRKFLLLLSFPLILGWMLIIFGEDNVKIICLGRFIDGLSFGAITVVVPLYTNEIAEDSVRGSVGVYLDFMLCVGILWSYIWGAITNLFWLSTINCLVPIVFFCTFFWMPESPVYLLSQGNLEEAEKSLRWLRGAKSLQHYDPSQEILRIRNLLDEANKRRRATVKISDIATLKDKFKSFSFQSPTSKAVAICFGLFTFQRLSGISAVVYYTVDIFRGAESSIAPTTATIIVGVFAVLSSATSTLLVDKLGRRFLLIFSNVFMSISLAVMALYSFLMENNVPIEDYKWIPAVAMSTLIAVFRVGLGPLPWFMMAELLPTEVKQWATSSVVCYTWFLTFFITKVFVWFVDNLGYVGTYSTMCIVCIIGIAFNVFCVPETKNKTPDEIRNSLTKVKYSSISQ